MKGTKIYSILKGKCPVCHEGDLYQKRNPYVISDTLKMHERCSHCDTKYKIEPSFFYGAMYVSYALTVAMAVAVFVICYLIGLELIPAFIAIVIILVISNPFVMRISRLLYINMFVHFQNKKIK